MPVTAGELLVVLDNGAPDEALRRVRRSARVMQILHPRIALVRPLEDEGGRGDGPAANSAGSEGRAAEAGDVSVRALPGRGSGLAAELSALPGVIRVCEADGAEAPSRSGEVSGVQLDSRERLFVAAWRARAHPEPSPGEGLVRKGTG